MATHSSVLAWRIPGTGEPGGLPSMGSHRVGHDWSDLAAAAANNSIGLFFLLFFLFETLFPSLDCKDPLEMEMATLSSIFACGIPWTEASGGAAGAGLPSMGSQRVIHNSVTKPPPPNNCISRLGSIYLQDFWPKDYRVIWLMIILFLQSCQREHACLRDGGWVRVSSTGNSWPVSHIL